MPYAWLSTGAELGSLGDVILKKEWPQGLHPDVCTSLPFLGEGRFEFFESGSSRHFKRFLSFMSALVIQLPLEAFLNNSPNFHLLVQ